MIDKKKCSMCLGIKKVTEFRKDSRYECGLSSNCKSCVSKVGKASRARLKAWKIANALPTTKGLVIPYKGKTIKVGAHSVRRLKRGPDDVYTKRCVACKKWKLVDEFRSSGYYLQGECTKCDKAYRKQWREDNREHLREQGRARTKRTREEKEALIKRVAELEATAAQPSKELADGVH